MANISKINRKRESEAYQAQKNRQEIIAARLTRRDMVKLGLISSTGYLVHKRGLSAWADTDDRAGTPNQSVSPPTTPFTKLLPIMPIKQSVASLNPAPTVTPNTAAGERRTRNHQAPDVGLPFPAPVLYEVFQQAGTVNMSDQLPLQTIWGFDGISPGPTYMSSYGTPILVRNRNNLPSNNGGFGLNSVTTHLHNGHTPSESDGFPCDSYSSGYWYDQYYPNVLAGFNSTHKQLNLPVTQRGDINEAMSTLWYHDHRVDFTAQNVYKGLAGFYLLFNAFDTGNETTGFRLPTFPAYDIPMMFNDKCFDLQTGLLFFDLFNLDGILGDKFLVNGVIQPVLHVQPRRYRFRWLNGGPSRFYQIYLTDLTNLSANNQFWQISNDGNLLPTPVLVPAVALGVAERADVIIDFASFYGTTLYLENRQLQLNGRGPTDTILNAGQGNLLLKIVVDQPLQGIDNSVNPATLPLFYALPDKTAPPRVSREFKFDLTRDGQWVINDQFMDCDTVRFRIKQNSVENWTLKNPSRSRDSWAHPIHIHFEEFQFLSGAPGLNGSGDPNQYYRRREPPITGVANTRKDVVRLLSDSDVVLFFRFRDFLGRYPLHCHNTIHEDHAMMLRWDIDTTGDTESRP